MTDALLSLKKVLLLPAPEGASTAQFSAQHPFVSALAFFLEEQTRLGSKLHRQRPTTNKAKKSKGRKKRAGFISWFRPANVHSDRHRTWRQRVLRQTHAVVPTCSGKGHRVCVRGLLARGAMSARWFAGKGTRSMCVICFCWQGMQLAWQRFGIWHGKGMSCYRDG